MNSVMHWLKYLAQCSAREMSKIVILQVESFPFEPFAICSAAGLMFSHTIRYDRRV